MRRLVWLLLIPLSGCNAFSNGPAPWPEKTGEGTGPTLWLNYTLSNHGDPNRHAYYGPHCGTARPSTEWVRHEDGSYTTRDTYESVFVDESNYAQLGPRRPFVVVTLTRNSVSGGDAGFVSFGREGYAAGIPFAFDPQIGVEPGMSSTPLTSIDVRDGSVYVDDGKVVLPHSWAKAEPGNWSATFHLSQGPSKVDLFRMGNCA